MAKIIVYIKPEDFEKFKGLLKNPADSHEYVQYSTTLMRGYIQTILTLEELEILKNQ